MTREIFEEMVENMGFFQAVIELENESDEVTNEEALKDFVKYKIDNDDYFVAVHILNALNSTYSENGLYRYDYSMGTLDTPTPIDDISDIEDLLF